MTNTDFLIVELLALARKEALFEDLASVIINACERN